MNSNDPAAPAPEDPGRRPSIDYPCVLEGQQAIVTGANSGIGRAVALGLARAGADIAINYLVDDPAAEAVARDIESIGRRAVLVKGDVSREEDVLAMFVRAIEALGDLHICVANAGMQRDAPFEDMTLEQWRAVLDVNLTGQFLCAREAVRHFRRRGPAPELSAATGKIICMSSVHQAIPWAGHTNYAASKGGVQMLMKSLAQEVAPRRIRVNAIAPGAVRTGINTAVWSTPQAYAELMHLVPDKRIGEPDDIARAAVWLASDASDYVTGETLVVDGGMSLYPGFATGG